MTETKPFWQSKTLWGGVIMILPTVLAFLGVDLTTEETAQIGSVVESIVEAVGFIFVIIGRIGAAKAIGVTPS